jgi:C-terminal processing protease CtpA/Prc
VTTKSGRARPRCTLVSLFAAALLVACGGKGAGTGSGQVVGGGSCDATAQKQFVLNTAREWYLFPELLPASIDPSTYADATSFLDALTATARAQGRDRSFSYVTSIAAEQALLSGGESAGFGISLLIDEPARRVFVGQVFESSAAADAGLARGDEILAVGTSAATLQPVATLLATPNGLTEAIGPSTAGTVRTLRWRNLAGQEFTREIIKRTFSIVPVPPAQVRLIQRPGLAPVGHLTLRTFISTADAELRNAFRTFRSNGVRDLIVDLRYNGGGLVSTAELLLNLLAGDRTNQVSYATRFNPGKASSEQTVRFQAQAETIPTLRVAFVTTRQSASASELVANSLAPYAQTVLVGGRTFGKPVGQFAFDIAACDFRLRLVTFKSVNARGDGDYFAGLPYQGFAAAGGQSCAAVDDLSHLPGDPAEAMTAAALNWISNGVCPAGAIADQGISIAGGAGAVGKSAAELDAGRLVPLNYERPNELQRLVPGAS